VRRVRAYRVSSLAIRHRNLGEADRIVVLYTRERGKLSAVAKGVRRTRSKLAGGLQLFSHARVQLAAGRSLEIVTQAQPNHLFYHVREDLQRYAHASYAAELVDVMVEDQAADPALFDLLLSVLQGLDEEGDPPTLIQGFQLKVLGHLGHGPEVESCVGCGTRVGTRGAGFSVAEGGVMCERCGGSRTAAGVTPAALQAMRDLVELPMEELAKRRLTGSVREELGRLLQPFVEYRLPWPLRSAEFLEM